MIEVRGCLDEKKPTEAINQNGSESIGPVISTAIVDSDRVYVRGLELVFTDVVLLTGKFYNPEEAFSKIIQLKPGLVIIGLNRVVGKGREALELLKALGEASKRPKILVLSGAIGCRANIEHIDAALEVDAEGIMLKADEDVKFPDAVRRINQGERVLSKSIARYVVERSTKPNSVETDYLNLRGKYEFSPQEIRVMNLLLMGETRAEISKQLEISDRTFANHTSNILGKLSKHGLPFERITEALSLLSSEMLRLYDD